MCMLELLDKIYMLNVNSIVDKLFPNTSLILTRKIFKDPISNNCNLFLLKKKKKES